MARGFFRLWIVLTVIWGAFVFFALSFDRRPEATEIAFEVTFVPSGIVLIIGLLLAWAFKGFSRHN
jgi:hypothetical protein